MAGAKQRHVGHPFVVGDHVGEFGTDEARGRNAERVERAKDGRIEL